MADRYQDRPFFQRIIESEGFKRVAAVEGITVVALGLPRRFFRCSNVSSVSLVNVNPHLPRLLIAHTAGGDIATPPRYHLQCTVRQTK